ncbi:MAG: tRNA (adenosine(37)-N6)-dimethylallyltransferase MiaA [Alphaproteobacteria bacterium]|nr:tRNA (adenosine(37)-N6)-dimethylallyltransferase MiaA [Alphaproteobacteria bacterium]
MKPSLHLITGPTASGKSALALALARQLGGNIINADAMQLYKSLPILTAQPEKEEIPHLLYEILEPSQKASVGFWLEAAQKAIAQTLQEGRIPLIIGGTGLYFEVLAKGLAGIPPIDETTRARARELYEMQGHDGFRAALAKLDPQGALLIDRQRLIRAYEVVVQTQKPLHVWQSESQSQGILNGFTIHHHPIMPQRAALYEACNKRFLTMMERGALEEVRALKALNLDPSLPSMKIIGVPELSAYLDGALSLETAITKAQQATRHYAKRQMTWFRHHPL